MSPPKVPRKAILNSFLKALQATSLDTLDRLDDLVFVSMAKELKLNWLIQRQRLKSLWKNNLNNIRTDVLQLYNELNEVSEDNTMQFTTYLTMRILGKNHRNVVYAMREPSHRLSAVGDSVTRTANREPKRQTAVKSTVRKAASSLPFLSSDKKIDVSEHSVTQELLPPKLSVQLIRSDQVTASSMIMRESNTVHEEITQLDTRP
ncbi:unnamed protein product [Didymodactylos carnosus]|uniref:Uncharacterized protein n=1 Tax=Didymodactylos carnosus TaxID=1234261 RepID=A0A815M2X1_9BILA|nr:unnamed protein product [Didymodactylos carnosus]CAF4301347.1 unnamed protein product [Didymodactylos carnosus]